MIGENAIESFEENGFIALPGFLKTEDCKDVLDLVRKAHRFGSELFMGEEEFRRNPQYKGVNPMPGRNLAESFDLRFIEENPELSKILDRILGSDYKILGKKFVVGVPDSWLPEWVKKQTTDVHIANLGAYLKKEYRDVTCFHGIDLHQDLIDYPERDCDFITFYVYLENTDKTTSPLFIVPGSHKFGATRFPHEIEVQSDADRIVYGNGLGHSENFPYKMLTGEAGSIYFWHPCLLHGTQPHLAKNPRISLRYLLEKGPGTESLLETVNKKLQGPRSLHQTREDLDPNGMAVLRGNTMNILDRKTIREES